MKKYAWLLIAPYIVVTSSGMNPPCAKKTKTSERGCGQPWEASTIRDGEAGVNDNVFTCRSDTQDGAKQCEKWMKDTAEALNAAHERRLKK